MRLVILDALRHGWGIPLASKRFDHGRYEVVGHRNVHPEPLITLHHKLVEAFEAIPARLNPHSDAAIRHLDRWVVDHDLIVRTWARERFQRAGFGWFAAATYPTAGEEDLALVADWFAWLFLLDDQLDDGSLGRSPDRTGSVLGAVFDVLNGHRADPSGPSIVTSLDDLWQRTSRSAGPGWCRRFVDHVVAGGMAARWEAGNRVRGIVPGEAAYIENRRHTGAIYVCMDLIEIIEHIDIPARVYESEPFAGALQAACDVVCWTNDLYSLDKETSLGEYHNLVTVVQHGRDLGQAEAIQTVANMIAKRLGQYLAYEPAVRAAYAPWPAEVEAYLAGMRSWMRGNLDWSASTRRYRDVSRDNGDPADYLEPRLITVAGPA